MNFFQLEKTEPGRGVKRKHQQDENEEREVQSSSKTSRVSITENVCFIHSQKKYYTVSPSEVRALNLA
jgi:hypothetical protein